MSGEALYYLSAAPELSRTSGKYFYLTLDAQPLQCLRDGELRAAIWEQTLRRAGLAPELFQREIRGQLPG